jgi:signal recognition particle subunit SEC65
MEFCGEIVIDKILIDDLLDILLKSNYTVKVKQNEENPKKTNVIILKDYEIESEEKIYEFQ